MRALTPFACLLGCLVSDVSLCWWCVCAYPPPWSRECGHTEWSVRFGGLKVDKLDTVGCWMVAKIDKRQTETLSYIYLIMAKVGFY